MKHALMLLPLVLMASMTVLNANDNSESLKIYVSKNGADQWSGTLGKIIRRRLHRLPSNAMDALPGVEDK